MRVPDVVIEALMRDEGLGHYARPLYLLICAAEPKSMSELARLAGMSRNVVARVCRNLADLDWVKLIRIRDKSGLHRISRTLSRSRWSRN